MPFGRYSIFRIISFICVLFIIMISVASSFRSGLWRSMGRVKPLHSKSMFSSIRDRSLMNHPSFDIIEDFHIKEYGLSGSILSHRKSGAQVLSVIAPDDNKVFGITFRTPPNDSAGLPHILEHSVLCGSRKFPVKEPFVDLLRGSLQNFLNAFTYPDRTCYPVASTNTKDFYNLVHVYLDAVLNPRAVHDPQVLQQEGWHYELTRPEDPLTIKGVVYNEMKGVYSSPDSLLGRCVQQELFPNNTYAVDSGGNPADIPKLTFAQFQEFHRLYYHPSNSRIFFYGNDDPHQRLVLLDEYLSNFQSIPTKHSEIAMQPKLNLAGKHVKEKYPIAPESEPKHMLTVNWLLNEKVWDSKELLALDILDYLLLGRSTSKLRKILTESQLGESVTGGGLSDDLIQSTFSTGLKGVKAENVEKVKALIHDSLRSIAKEGFSKEEINAAINSLEFRLREFNTGSYPKGLSVMLGMTKPWIYDRSPIDGVSFEGPLQALKDDLAAGTPIFQNLLNTYFVNNQHCVSVEMVPDTTLEQLQAQEEETHLQNIKQSMSKEEIEQIISSTVALQEAQERPDTPEARATLPKLGLEDIDPNVTEFPIEVVKESLRGDPYTVVTHPLPTNGILYTDIAFDYSTIPIEDIELLPLFTRLLMESNTQHYSANELQQLIDTYTGGISVSLHQDLLHSQGKIVTPDENVLFYLLIRGKATQANIPKLYELMQEILLHSNLNNPTRALEMVKEMKIRKESAILSSGHSYASTRLSCQYSFMGYYGECLSGITSVRNAGKLVQDVETTWETNILPRLERLRQQIIHTMPIVSSKSTTTPTTTPATRKVIINLTGEDTILQSSMPVVDSFVGSLPTKQENPMNKDLISSWKERKDELVKSLGVPTSRSEGFVIPSMVNYVGYGGMIYHPQEEVHGSTSVVTRYLSNGYMWDNIRVLGGAYGGFARFSDVSGRLTYLSYRDPNVLNTLNTYKGANAFLSEQEISSEDMLQAIIGTIGDLDSPLSADQKGYSSFLQYLTQETKEHRQEWRNHVLQTKPEDFKQFAERMKQLHDTTGGAIVVFGSQQALEQANAALPENEKMTITQALTGMNNHPVLPVDSHDQEE